MEFFAPNTIASPSFSNLEYFRSAAPSEREAKMIGFSSMSEKR